MPRQSLLFAPFLALLLAACGNPQGGSEIARNDTNVNNTENQAGLILPVESTALNPAQIAAAKARVPHQYDEAQPLSLFDFRTNLNPNSNR